MFRGGAAQLSAVEGWRRAGRYLMGTSRCFSRGCFQFLGERKPGLEPEVKVGRGMEVEAERGKRTFEVVVAQSMELEGVLGNSGGHWVLWL